MKAISIVLQCTTICVALVGFGMTAHAADEFTDACMLGSSPGTDMGKTCACMAGKVPADLRADAAEALRRSYRAMSDTAQPLDPSTLPPNLLKGLQAAVLAQADCM